MIRCKPPTRFAFSTAHANILLSIQRPARLIWTLVIQTIMSDLTGSADTEP
jgi:hypothetical protein